MKSTVAPVPGMRQIENSRPPQGEPMAIIDVGSNSIRMVIFASQGHYPYPLFNERANCRLGEGVGGDGMLQEERIRVALATLARFAKILGDMGISKIHAFATAAVRRAKNAEQFTRPAAVLLPSSAFPLGRWATRSGRRRHWGDKHSSQAVCGHCSVASPDGGPEANNRRPLRD